MASCARGVVFGWGHDMRRLAAVLAFILAITTRWWWEFIRAFVIYDPLTHILQEQTAGISADTLVQIVAGGAFFVLGAWLVWPSRPEVLRWGSPVKVFLERDSAGEQYGIHTFPGESYIQ